MIWKQKLIAVATRANVLGFFHELKVVRDGCAHPGGDNTPLPKDNLTKFISSAKLMRSNLRDSMRTHGVGSRTELCWPVV